MRVKMVARAAGPAGGYSPGQVVDVADELGAAWVAAGYAEAVATGKIETEVAMVEASEAAVKPGRRRAARKRTARKPKTTKVATTNGD